MTRSLSNLSLALPLAIALHATSAPSRAEPVAWQEPGSASAPDWLQIAERNEAITAEQPHNGQAWLRWGQALLELDAGEEALEVLGRAEEELAAEPFQRGQARFALARVHAARGEVEPALALLEKAVLVGVPDLAVFERAPELRSLASDARYRRLHEELREQSEPRLQPGLPVSLDVLVPPHPFGAHGKKVLAYELHLASYWPKELTVTAIDVLDRGKSLFHFEGAELSALLERPGDARAERTRLPGNARVVAFLWLAFERGATLPARLEHRVQFEGPDLFGRTVRPILAGGPVSPGEPAVVIGPPLRGEQWVPRSAGNWSYHHRSLRPVGGRLAHAQRFAADWGRAEDVVWGSNGKFPRGNEDLRSFGQDVLAVADGVIADVRDGSPDNVLSDAPLALPMLTAFGNHVVLDLGRGRFATYAHLRQGSVRVRPGQRVRRGDVLAAVGNSGDATGPHLHFHVSTSASPYEGEGLPYVLDSFGVLGWEMYEAAKRGELPALDLASRDVRHEEMPIDSVVLRFL